MACSAILLFGKDCVIVIFSRSHLLDMNFKECNQLKKIICKNMHNIILKKRINKVSLIHFKLIKMINELFKVKNMKS